MEIKLSKKVWAKVFPFFFLENVASNNGCINMLMSRQFYFSMFVWFVFGKQCKTYYKYYELEVLFERREYSWNDSLLLI